MKFSRAFSQFSPMLLLAAALPASAATLSVGPGKTYAAPCKALTVAKSGDLIEITGNTTYSGDVCYVSASNITIRGVNGRPKIDAAGKNANGKGIWVIGGSNVTVENVEMLGAKVPDLNGAALRLEGTNFTLRQAYLHDNENGILMGVNTSSDVLVEYSEFSHNGRGDSQTHNLYIGTARSLTFRYNYSHDANAGHNLKSRALTNMIAYNRFSSSGLGAPSYEIDLPNAGTSYIIGNVIQQPAVNNNSNIVAYGAEGASNPGQDLYVVNNTFLNDYGSGGTFVMIKNVTKPALIQNNIFAGVGSVTNQTNATLKTNYSAAAPGFINRAAFDLHPTANAQVINAGSAPGNSASGIALAPTGQYKATAYGETRPVSGNLDIGAYEAASTTTTTTPAPTPAPAPAPTPTPTPTPAPAPSPAPTETWTACASQWGTCSFTGTRTVRYGANGVYVTKTVAGPVACTNAVFGDPLPGVMAKSCSYASTTVATATPAAPSPTPVATWTACASQWGTCSFSGTRQVRYGANGVYATKTVTGPVACTNAVFGDPLPGVMAKSCSYAS